MPDLYQTGSQNIDRILMIQALKLDIAVIPDPEELHLIKFLIAPARSDSNVCILTAEHMLEKSWQNTYVVVCNQAEPLDV